MRNRTQYYAHALNLARRAGRGRDGGAEMSSARSREILRLYRAILRRGEGLKYTDRDFFRKTVRLEFRRGSRDVDSEADVASAANIEVVVVGMEYGNFLVLQILYFLSTESQTLSPVQLRRIGVITLRRLVRMRSSTLQQTQSHNFLLAIKNTFHSFIILFTLRSYTK